MIRFLSAFALTITLTLTLTLSIAQVAIDNTWDSDGFLVFGDPDNGDYFGATAVNNDHIVVGFSEYNNTTQEYEIQINRFDDKGQPDASFGTSGQVEISISGVRLTCTDVAIQPDGKILICGDYTKNFATDFLVIRLNTDGSIDTGFGDNGFVKMNHDNQDFLTGITVDPKTGNIYASGYSNLTSGKTRPVSVSLLPGGQVNTDYGTNGVVEHGDSYNGRFFSKPQFVDKTKENDNFLTYGGHYVNNDTQSITSLVVDVVDRSGNILSGQANPFFTDTDYGIGDQEAQEVITGSHPDKPLVQDRIWVWAGGNRNSIMHMTSDGKVVETFGNNGSIDLNLDNEDFVGFKGAAQNGTGRIFTGGVENSNKITIRVHNQYTGEVETIAVPNGKFQAGLPDGYKETTVGSVVVDNNKLYVSGTVSKSPPDIFVARFSIPTDTLTVGMKSIHHIPVRAYPNPSGDQVYIDFNNLDQAKVLVFDALGREVDEVFIEVVSTNRVLLRWNKKVKPGTYTVRILTGYTALTTRIIRL